MIQTADQTHGSDPVILKGKYQDDMFYLELREWFSSPAAAVHFQPCLQVRLFSGERRVKQSDTIDVRGRWVQFYMESTKYQTHCAELGQ
jgi:hypothetical protein